MPVLLFVHGTGVREKGYADTLAEITSRVGAVADVWPCYWGDLGSSLNAGGQSIPTCDATRGLEDPFDPAVDSAAWQVALWDALGRDPLLELRALALKPHSPVPPWQQTQGSRLMARARLLEPNASLQNLLARGGLEPGVFERAQRQVCSSRAFQDALAMADEDIGDHRAALARAWIAAAARLVQQSTLERTGEWIWPAILLDGELRSELEGQLIEALGGEERGPGGWLMRNALLLAGWVLTPIGMQWRGAITDAAYPMAGDIVLYQARGEAIRARIRERILAAAHRGPVHLLAHSLGGVACVDLLASEDLPVSQLITVGSQAPFLYEINALRSLPYGEPLPPSMPPWLNLYDPRDFLSYVGKGVFPGPARVVDCRVNNCQPFPASHSAYWWNTEVWDAILPSLIP